MRCGDHPRCPAEILRSSLRAANAYRLCRTLSPRSVQRQLATSLLPAPRRGSLSADPEPPPPRREALSIADLKATAGCGHRRDVVRLSCWRKQDQLGVHFPTDFRDQHYFLRERGKS